MYLGTQEGNSLNLNLTHDHNVARINDAIGLLPKAWHAAKKYSVNNTLPIAVVNTWLQFSLAYITAMVITLNDLSFIATFNPTLMPTYFLVSVIFGVVLLTSLALRYIYKQEIKDEKSKDGDSPIDIKIRGGKSDEINEIAQNALTIEIVPDLVDKKQGFSIILPISEKQGEILENKRQENRNKVILLTVPYVLSGLIVAGALIQNKFSFANVHGWEEWGFIAFVSAVFIVGICIALSKLKSNEVNNACNIVKKFDNVDILLPWRKGSVVSVMENKFKSEEENNPISRLGRLVRRLVNRHLTDFIDKICCLFKNDLLKPANINIKEMLDHLKKIREDIKKDLDWLHAEISEVLNNTKELTKKAHSLDIEGTFSRLENAIKIAEDKIERFEPSRFVGWLQSTTQSNNNEFLSMLKKLKEDTEEEKTELKEQLNVVRNELEEIKKKQAQPSTPDLEANNGNNTNELLVLENKVKELRDTVRKLELEAEQNKLQQKKEKLEQKKSEQEKTDEWKEKINGKPSDFLYYLLESIKLEEKDNKEKKVEATLRNFDNKIIIHWKDGSKTTCHIKKQDGLQIQPPSTKVDFVDKNIHAAFKVACAG